MCPFPSQSLWLSRWNVRINLAKFFTGNSSGPQEFAQFGPRYHYGALVEIKKGLPLVFMGRHSIMGSQNPNRLNFSHLFAPFSLCSCATRKLHRHILWPG
jgi:hypothetical protein